MICRKCQRAMRMGKGENFCYKTGEQISLTKDTCCLCQIDVPSGNITKMAWKRNRGGLLTSQSARDNLRKRFGEPRSKRCQMSVSESVAKMFYATIPESDRRNRIDHALLVELGEAV